MSEEKKGEILGREGELDEGELEAVAGAKGDSCACVIAGVAESLHKGIVIGEGKQPCPAIGEGKPKPPCACFEAGNSGDWKP